MNPFFLFARHFRTKFTKTSKKRKGGQENMLEIFGNTWNTLQAMRKNEILTQRDEDDDDGSV